MDQVEHVHALIDEFPTTCELRHSAPLALVAGTAAMTVPRADVEQVSVHTRVHLGGSAGDGRMEAVVEADLHEPSRPVCCFDHPIDLRAAQACRLFDEHVRTGGERFLGNGRETIVRGRDDDNLRLQSQELIEARARPASELRGELCGGARKNVCAPDQRVTRTEGRGANPSDPTAAHDPDAEGGGHGCSVAVAPENSKSNTSSDAPAAAIA
jgi:hypothetical protein